MRQYLRKYPFTILFTALVLLAGSIYVGIRFPMASSEMFLSRDAGLGKEPPNPSAFNETLAQQNSGLMPWEHHSIFSTPHESKHNKSTLTSYELSNTEFAQIFRKTFVRGCITKVSKEDWTESPMTNELEPIYNDFLKWFRAKVQEMNSAYQVVHDKLIEMHRRIVIVPDVSADQTLLKVETIIYRVGSYHGKHVEMWALLSPNKNPLYDIVSFDVVGEVKEEDIFFHPIASYDPMNAKVDYAPNTDGVSGTPFLKTVSDDEINEIIRRQQAKRSAMFI